MRHLERRRDTRRGRGWRLLGHRRWGGICWWSHRVGPQPAVLVRRPSRPADRLPTRRSQAPEPRLVERPSAEGYIPRASRSGGSPGLWEEKSGSEPSAPDLAPYERTRSGAHPSPRQRGSHPDPGARRARDRVRRGARSGRVRAVAVPGRGPAGARGTHPRPDRHRADRGQARRRAQAARRDRHDPGPDRRPRAVAVLPPRRGREDLRPGLRHAPGDARARRRRGRGGRAGRPRRAARRHRTARRAAVRARPPAGQPLPRARLHRRLAEPRPGPPAGRLGAARPAVPLLRGGRQRRLDDDAAARGARRDAAGRPAADEAPGRGGGGGRRRSPHLPARRRARPRQDGPGAARGRGRRRVPDARRGAQRREDELGPRGQHLGAPPDAHGHPRRRPGHQRLRRRGGRQLRGARPARRLARRLRLPLDGGRRGALHQEQDLAALAERAPAVRADPLAHRPTAVLRPHRNAADQRHRGLPGDLAVPRLDRRQEAARCADGRARGDRPDAGRPRLLPRGPHQRRRPGHRPPPQGRRRQGHPGPPHRRHPRRARRRDRALDPRGRGRAGPASRGEVRVGAGHPTYGSRPRRRRHRPRPGPPRGDVGARGLLRRVHAARTCSA